MDEPGRVLGIDPGEARIGLALSDPLRMIAHPLEAVSARPRKDALRRVAEICRDREVAEVVCGLPLHMFGEEGEEARKARRLAAAVESETGLPVHLLDERLSSAEAERHLLRAGLSHGKRKARRDAVAAQLVLQAWLDRDS